MEDFIPSAFGVIVVASAIILYSFAKKIQGDIAGATLSASYLALAGGYTVLYPEWSIAGSLARSAFLLASSFITISICCAAYRLSPVHSLHKIPGPLLNRITELPLAYYAARLIRHRYLYELHAKYGPIVRIAPNSVSINSNAALYIIHKSAQCFDKTAAYDLHLKGEGLFFVKERDRHAVIRRPWSRALSGHALKHYTEPLFRTTQAYVDRLLQDVKKNGVVDLVRCTDQWAFDTAALLTFGGNGTETSLLASNDPAGLAEKPRIALASFEFFSHFPWLFHILKHFPTAIFRQVEEFSLRQAERRLGARQVQFRDIFSYWIEETDNVDLDKLATESLAAIVAATETIGSMTSLVFFFLLDNPRWHKSLCEELDSTFSPSSPLSVNSVDQLDGLPILNAVIQEAFRLGAIFSGLGRVVPPGGAVLDGHYLPEGTSVSVPIYARHLSPEDFGPEPNVFDPQRWLTKSFGRPMELLTFGAGPFNCVGKRLAYKQTRLVLACAFLQLNIAHVEGFDTRKFWAAVGNLRATIIREPLQVVVAPRLGMDSVVLSPTD